MCFSSGGRREGGGESLETLSELKIQLSCGGMFKDCKPACLAKLHHNPVLAWLAPDSTSAHCSSPKRTTTFFKISKSVKIYSPPGSSRYFSVLCKWPSDQSPVMNDTRHVVLELILIHLSDFLFPLSMLRFLWLSDSPYCMLASVCSVKF